MVGGSLKREGLSVYLWLIHIVIGYACVLSCFSLVELFVTPWTVACQAFLSVGFCRQEYRNALPYPPPGDLSNLGIEPTSPAAPLLQAESTLSHRGSPVL